MQKHALIGRRSQTRNHFRPAHLPLFSFLMLFFLIGLSACSSVNDFFNSGTWQSSGLAQQHLRVLFIDANNTQVVYAGSEQQGVFTSTDGGQHWGQHSTGLPLPTAVHALSFDGAGKKLYVATDAGLFVSADAAQHWQLVSATGLPTDAYTAFAVGYNVSQPIYVGTTHHGVFKSADDGATWTSFSSGLPSDVLINGLTVDQSQKQIWAATSQGIYRFDATGTMWQALTHGLPAKVVVYTVQPATLIGGTQGLVLAGTEMGLYSSQDGGASWTNQQVFATLAVYSVLFDFRNAMTVYIGTHVGAYRSDDNGQNWRGVAPGLSKQSVYALAIGANNNSQLFAASDDIYLYPGKVGGFNFSLVVSFVAIILFFYLLYRLVRGSSKRSRNALKPERIIESSSPTDSGEAALVPFETEAQEKASLNGHRVPQKPSVGGEGEFGEGKGN